MLADHLRGAMGSHHDARGNCQAASNRQHIPRGQIVLQFLGKGPLNLTPQTKPEELTLPDLKQKACAGEE